MSFQRPAIRTEDLKKVQSIEAFDSLYGFSYMQAVAWGDMDSFKHVNNVHYFRYYESSRVNFLGQTSLFDDLAKDGLAPVLAEISCRYLVPVVYPDTLYVASRTASADRTSMVLDHAAFSVQQRRVVATGKASVVIIDYATGRRSPMPQTALEHLLS